MTIDGATTLLAIIADPVKQARTPGLINASIARRGYNAALVPMHVGTTGLAAAIEGLRSAANFGGAVVSMPHKRAVMRLLDNVTREAAEVGACNVIRRTADGRLIGTMLDGWGFVRGLERAGIDVVKRRVLLLGAGGAAAGIAFALAPAGIESLAIANRTRSAAEALAVRVQQAYPTLAVRGDTNTDPKGCDLVVNATSLGMRDDDPLPVDVTQLDPDAVAAEAVLAPDETRFLAEAAARGLRTHRGRHMLEAQIEQMLDFMMDRS
jgi:shikimate dehydrogenase